MEAQARAQPDEVKSAARTIAIIEWLDRCGRPAKASEIEEALGYPSSSTLALLSTLTEAGYLLQDLRTRTYRPSLICMGLGRGFGRPEPGRSTVEDVIRKFADVTDETIMLSCQTELAMLFVRKRPGKHAVPKVVEPGDRAPLFRSAVGLAALSKRSDPAIRSLVSRFNRRLWVRDRLDVVRVLRDVHDVRAKGWCSGYDLYQANTGAIAWPLHNSTDGHTLVLSIGGDSKRLRRNESAIVQTGIRVVQT